MDHSAGENALDSSEGPAVIPRHRDGLYDNASATNDSLLEENRPDTEANRDTDPLLQSSGAKHFQTYGRRWFVLAVFAVLNISNGMMWVSFSPVADFVAEYYGVDATQVNMLSVVFMITTITLSLIAVWLLDVQGLRFAIILSSWLNVSGSVLRVVSCLDIPVKYRYPVLMGGQTLVALAQPLVMFAPTKVAALWFPASQRALANTITSVANPLGIMIGNLVAPAVVRKPNQVFMLNVLCVIPAALAVVLATGGVCSSRPPTPPSASAAHASEPFLKGLRKLMRCGPHWLLAMSFGTTVGLFTVFNTLIEQVLCVQGYTDTFAGWCGALMIIVGLVGAALAAVYVDKTKHFVEVSKCGISIASICLIAFLVVSRYPDMQVVLIVLASLVGFFGFASNPVTLELSVECTYPVAEASSAGLLLLSSQVQSLVLVLVMEALARPYDLDLIPRQTCHTTGVMGMTPKDYTIPNYILCALGTAVCVVFTAFFKCDFKRMKAEAEQEESDKASINNVVHSSSSAISS